ncbi:MAG: holo-ACP synthase [Bacilli bacterium]|jgi:holo-[acyl-carrier protein] synthase|nr:holo-ACP synthase [Bacilli bacterium]MDD4056040.1 holo-ACP synthase [Bacilli bacterium]MDY0209429.1 holo-ACP synthase [Bacilli bacterium]
MIEKIGVDISENSRFVDMINDEKHYRKILSQTEMNVFKGFLHEKRKLEYLASRFSAKEALFKAYNKEFNFTEVSILNHEDGSPYIEADFLENYVVHISISHEKAYSIAFVILER